MAIKFSQFNLRTDHTSGMYLVGYDGNQNIHITVDNLFDDFINGTENTIAMFGTDGTALADSILSQDAGATILTVAGQLNVDAAATFDTSVTVTGDSTLNGNVILGDASTDLITQTGTLYLNGPIKDTTNTLGIDEQILVSDAIGELTFRDLYNTTVGRAEAVVQTIKCNEAIPKGCPVYIVGFQPGENANIVEKADASNPAKMPATGVADEDYAAQDFGTMTAFGSFNGDFDTTGGTENWAIGDILYVKSGGGLTNIKPTGTNLIQNIAIVSRVQSQTGEMEVIALGRTNDIPNLTPGRLWIGSTGNTIESQTIFVDEANTQVGIGTASPQGAKLHVVRGANTTAINLSNTDTRASLKLKSSSSSDSQITFSQGASATQIIQASNEAADTARNINLNPFGGNVGIGTTLPSKKLHVATTGSVDIAKFETTGNAAILIERTASLQPGASKLTVANNGQLGIASDNNIKFSTSGHSGGTERMRINNDGKVGIGTTSPATIFHIAAQTTPTIRIEDTTNNKHLQLFTDNNSTYMRSSTGTPIYFQTDGANTRMFISSGGQIQFSDYGAGTFTGTATKNLAVDSSGNVIETDGGVVDGSGTANYVSKWSDPNTLTDSVIYDDGTNVGVGTATPGSLLHVTGSSTNAALQVDQTGTGVIANFKTSANSKVLITNSGNVGIGTTSPGAKLAVDSGSNGVAGYINVDSQNFNRLKIGYSFTDAPSGIGAAQIFVDSSGNLDISSRGDNASNIQFYTSSGTSPSEVMRITSSGDVGIGTTSPDSKLHIRGDNPVIHINDSNSTTRYACLAFSTAGGFWNISSGDSTAGASSNLFITRADDGTANRFIFHRDSYYFGVYDNTNTIKAVIRANGNSYFNGGNVGIGTTSPSRPLTIESAATSIITEFKYTGAGYSSIDLANTAGSARISSINNDLALSPSGAEKVRITSTGNVGIGTTAPEAPIHISTASSNNQLVLQRTDTFTGKYKIYTNSNNLYFYDVAQNALRLRIDANGDLISSNDIIINNTAGDPYLKLKTAAQEYVLRIDQSDSEKFQIRDTTNSATRVTLDTSGNIGIGTDSPSTKLEVAGAVGNFQTTGHQIFLTRNGNNEIYAVGASSVLALGTNSAEKMRIDSSGNIGIGTTSPALKLEVEGGDGLLQLSTTSSFGSPYMSFAQAGTRRSFIQHDASFGLKLASEYGGISFFTGTGGTETEKMTILSGGNVGIGTTSPASKLDVNGGIRMADDSSTASASNVGTLRYRTSGNNSYVDMCMQTGASTYAWVNIVQNNW